MKHYKSFREKLLECKKNGNLIKVDISEYNTFPKTALVCLKYKTICHSGICRDERIQEDKDDIISDLEAMHASLGEFLKKALDK